MIYDIPIILKGSQKANNDIKEKIDSIRRCVINSKVSDKIIALLIGGGFGRGEGSVVLVGEKYETSNDYDIFAICCDDIDSNVVNSLAKEIEEKLNLKFFGIDIVKISFLKKLNKECKMSQSHYDFIFGTIILWTNDLYKKENIKTILDKLKYTSNNILIPPKSAFDVLKTRMWCIIAMRDISNKNLYDVDFCDDYYSFYYQQVKACTAIVDAIVIADRMYNSPRFSDKLQYFQRSLFSKNYDTSLIVELIRRKIENESILKLSCDDQDNINDIYCHSIDYVVDKYRYEYMKYRYLEWVRRFISKNIKKEKVSDWFLRDYKILKNNKSSKEFFRLQQKVRGVNK